MGREIAARGFRLKHAKSIRNPRGVDEYSVALPVAHRAGIESCLRQKGVAMKSIPDGEEVAGDCLHVCLDSPTVLDNKTPLPLNFIERSFYVS